MSAYSFEWIETKCKNPDKYADPEHLKKCLCNFPQSIHQKLMEEVEIPGVCWNPYCTESSYLTELQIELMKNCKITDCIMHVSEIDLSGDVVLTIDNQCYEHGRGTTIPPPRPLERVKWHLPPIIVPALILLCVSLFRR